MWSRIAHLIPKDKVIWEACMLNSNSKSKQYLSELGFTVIGFTFWDILKTDPPCDIIVTNPPFKTSIKKQILQRLVELDKPFIIIMNSMNLFTNYFRSIFKDKIKDLQIITPRGKIKFEYYNEKTKLIEPIKTAPAFYCVYVAYKMNINNEHLWLK
jgi:hypothetical protein